MDKLRTIISLAIGIPAAMVVFGESSEFGGFALQLVALAILGLILAINGAFSRKEARW